MQTNDIADLPHDERIIGEGKPVGLVELQFESTPDSLNLALGNPALTGRSSRAAMRSNDGFTVQSCLQ